MLSNSRLLRVSSAEIGEKGSPDLGVLGLSGLPANAWDFRFIDMVLVKKEKVFLDKVTALVSERWDLERTRGVGVEEKRRESMALLSHRVLVWF